MSSNDISADLNALSLEHKSPLEQPLPVDTTQYVSICVDYSNIRHFYSTDRDIKVNVRKLVQLLEGDRNVFYRGVAGSSNSTFDMDVIKFFWGSCGYEMYFELRQPRQKETYVDEIVKSMILDKSLGPHTSHMANLKIVLVTGDGNDNHKGCMSFPQVVEYAITKHNRDVEVWAISDCLHERFSRLRRKYPTKLTIMYLDNPKLDLYHHSIY